jgi:hypothetical protein
MQLLQSFGSLLVREETRERTTHAQACSGAQKAHKQAVTAGPIHENGILSAPTVSGQRFRGGGGRPVFGLWAAYSVAASHLMRETVRDFEQPHQSCQSRTVNHATRFKAGRAKYCSIFRNDG